MVGKVRNIYRHLDVASVKFYSCYITHFYEKKRGYPEYDRFILVVLSLELIKRIKINNAESFIEKHLLSIVLI